MPDDDVWPPKPNLPDPLTEHDELIAAKLAALPVGGAGRNRLSLIKAVRNEGLDLRHAYACVNSYCNRHGVLVPPKTARITAWLGCLGQLIALCLICLLLYLDHRRDELMRLPHHHAAFLAVRNELRLLLYALTAAFLLNITIIFISIRRRSLS